MKPRFFASPATWRRWLTAHHDVSDEWWVGFYRKGSGRPSITWPESVDEALCFGWIDGLRKSMDSVSYAIRFTPRRPGSNWSAVNTRRAAELLAKGLMRPAGLRAYRDGEQHRSGGYGYEQRRRAKLPLAYEREMRANAKAWRFFTAQPPWYQQTAAWWVISATKEETRAKRLAMLVEDSAHHRAIAPLVRRKPGRGPSASASS